MLTIYSGSRFLFLGQRLGMYESLGNCSASNNYANPAMVTEQMCLVTKAVNGYPGTCFQAIPHVVKLRTGTTKQRGPR